MKRLLCASLTFNSFYRWSNFLKNMVVSHNFWPAYKIGAKPRKTVLVVKDYFVAYFSFQRYVHRYFEANKLQWWIGSHKSLVFLTDSLLNWSFCQTRLFFTFFNRWPCLMLPCENEISCEKIDVLVKLWLLRKVNYFEKVDAFIKKSMF